MKQKRDLITRRKKESGLDLERYKDENNKYIIQQYNQQKRNNDEINGTCLDSMCLFVENNGNMTGSQIMTLRKYLFLNEYDTEGVEEDLEDVVESENAKNESVSNIWNKIKNKLCILLMREYMVNIKCMYLSQI